jgi:hypothetical protein
MPLFDNACDLIRTNLEQISNGQKARLISIGTLTDTQLASINEHRAAQDLPAVIAEVVFIGKHIYQSRVAKDGYTIEDVVDQIVSAMREESAIIHSTKMTTMENPAARADRYGNQVRDQVVFECTTRHPRPELFSVVPTGDNNRPKK